MKILNGDFPANNGQYKPGRPGGPGRPRREVERAYLDATISACSLADWAAVVRKAVADAKRGDARARRWLSDILVGRDPVALRDVLDWMRAELQHRLHGGASNGRSV
jgi:hypothetical protein